MITKDGIDLSVCAFCKTPLDQYSRTVDHLFPKSRGGKRSNKNKRPACGECNKLKGDLDIYEFASALNSLIFFEHENHRKTIGHLKKVKMHVNEIIKELKDDKKQNNI